MTLNTPAFSDLDLPQRIRLRLLAAYYGAAGSVGPLPSSSPKATASANIPPAARGPARPAPRLRQSPAVKKPAPPARSGAA